MTYLRSTGHYGHGFQREGDGEARQSDVSEGNRLGCDGGHALRLHRHISNLEIGSWNRTYAQGLR